MSRGQRRTLAAGVVIAVAVLAGMDSWAAHSLTGHMLQHVALMTVAAPLIALGLAGHPWYVGYRSLSDQQLAGAIMWAVAGAVYVVAGAALVFTWLAGVERRSPARFVPLERMP